VITETDPASIIISINDSFDLVLHATDVDEDSLTWIILTDATHGTASVDSGTGSSQTIHYTPTPGYTGPDTFVVQVSDGKGGVDTFTVNVTINNRNTIYLPIILN
jgi:hypothetical protein